MDIKKTIQNTVVAGIIGSGSFAAGSQLTEHKLEELANQNKKEIQQTMNWSNSQIDVFEQQQAVIRGQRRVLDQWDSCSLCKEKCSI